MPLWWALEPEAASQQHFSRKPGQKYAQRIAQCMFVVSCTISRNQEARLLPHNPSETPQGAVEFLYKYFLRTG